MSRFRRVLHSVASGYVLLGALAAYSLASVPLALHYLSDERFGLWTLMSSIGGYLSLIDLGMSGSVARLLIDHKDNQQGGQYGSLIQTGWLVLLTQGTLLLLAALVFAPLLAAALDIPVELRPQFISLLRWQGLAWALSFYTRISSHLLQAHQRIDLNNYAQLLALASTFLSLWLFFRSGAGLMSLAWAVLAGAITNGSFALLACWRLNLFPARGAWGRPSRKRFHELFDYGKDLFLVSVGTQLIMASQIMIITRRLGLAAAAAWYAGTRAFNLLNPAIWRLADFSMPAFSEMMVRGEKRLLCERYRSVLMLTASFSGFVAVTYALCNSSFVAVWIPAARHIQWPAHNDLLLGLWMIVLAVLHCHNSFVLTTKQIGFMRYVYFVEGLVFVGLALLVARSGGLPSIIACSIFCSVAFSGAYGVWRVCKYFALSLREVAWEWLALMARVLGLFVPVALAGWWSFQGTGRPLLRLVLGAALSGSFGLYSLLRFGLSLPVKEELLVRAPRGASPVLRRVFALSPR